MRDSRSLDEGKTWKRLHVAGGDALDFRGIVAFKTPPPPTLCPAAKAKIPHLQNNRRRRNVETAIHDKRKEFFLDSIACLSETRCLRSAIPSMANFSC